jgi:hypothetical protein
MENLTERRRVAVIRDGVVENVIIAAPGFELPSATLVDAEDAAIGATFDGRRFVRPEPPPPEPEQPRRPTIEERIAALEAKADVARVGG